MGRIEEEGEIVQGLRSLFQETNPNSFTSLNDVLIPLQSKLGFDLSDYVDFIRTHVALFLGGGQVGQYNTVVGPTGGGQQQQPHVGPPRQQQQQQQGVYGGHHRQHLHFGAGFGGGGGGGLVGPTQINFGGDVEHVTQESPRPKRRGGPGGLNKLCGVSPLLQTIVGQPTMPRTEIVKQLWAYIRKHNLQDPSNKRKIICNDELRLVFETDITDMFQMNKLLAKHIVPLDATKDSGQQSKKLKVEVSQVSSTEPSPAPAISPSPAPTTVVSASSAPTPTPTSAVTAPSAPASTAPVPPGPAPIVISEALANFFGVTDKEMAQPEVFKRIEEYVKVEGLEDPVNSMIVCDTKLQLLLGCDKISTPELREALARTHLFQRA